MNKIALLLCLLTLTVSATGQDFYVGVILGVSQFDGVADTDSAGAGNLTFPAANLPLNGLPFDGSETTWGVSGGWKINAWLAVQAGYTELGNNGTNLLTSLPALGGTNGVALGIDEWHIGAKVRTPITNKFSATALLGLTRASFETGGSLFSGFSPLILNSGIPAVVPNPGAIFTTMLSPDYAGFVLANPAFISVASLRIPPATPKDETGIIWGAGIEYDVNDHFAVDFSFRQHDTQVLNIDSWSLGLSTKF